MDFQSIVAMLSKALPAQLSEDLVREYLQIRHDALARIIGRGAPGKFVETVVQCLQHLETGTFSPKPEVEKFLTALESRPSSIRDDLRICVNRVGRAMYSLRSKRNIVHKGEVDPNWYDLHLLHGGAQWILAELLRTTASIPMSDAGKAIELISSPVGALIEDIAGRRIIHANLNAPDEIVILLQSHYPNLVTLIEIVASLNRRNSKSVANAVRDLYSKKLVEGSSKEGYILTRPGLEKARKIAGSI